MVRSLRSLRAGTTAMLALLALTLTGCTTGGGEEPSLTISLDRGHVTVSPGESVSVQVQLARDGGYSGAVSMAALGVPDGVSVSIVGDRSASTATVNLEASPTAEEGMEAEITVRAIGAGLAKAPASAVFTLAIVPPATLPIPSVVIVTDGYGASRQVRQAAGSIDLEISNPFGGADFTAYLEGVTAFGEDLVGDLLDATAELSRVRFYVPSGASIGEKALRLESAQHSLMVPDVLEITPIVLSPTGSDSNPGTFDLPLLSFTPEVLARAGDHIILLEGEYVLSEEALVPFGVSIAGMGDVVLRPTQPSTGSLNLEGDAVVTDLTLDGFGIGIVASTGTVRLERVNVTNPWVSGLRFGADGTVDSPTVKLVAVEVRDSAGYGIEILNSTEFTGSRVLVAGTAWQGILVNGDAPRIQMSDVTVVGAGSSIPASGILIDISGEGLFRTRSTLVSTSSWYGVEVRSGEYVDLGTEDDPGRNVLRANLEGQFLDARPARLEPDGQIITLVGTQWNGAYLNIATHRGPDAWSHSLTGQTYWLIENSNNRIQTGK